MLQNRSNINSLIVDALSHLENSENDLVIECAERVFAIDKVAPEALHVLGLLAMKLGEVLRARDLFEKAVEIAPDKYEHTEALAIINAKLGLLQESLFHGKMAAALVPYDSLTGLLPDWLGTFEENFLNIHEKPHFKMGRYLFNNKNYQEAINCLQQAVEIDPKETEAWRLLIRALRICGRSYEALLMAKSMDSLGLDEPSDLSEVALILSDMGLFEESFSCHQEVLRVVEDDDRLFSNYIYSIHKSGLSEDLSRMVKLWHSFFYEPIFTYNYKEILQNLKGGLTVGFVSGRFRSKDGLDHLWPLIFGFDSKSVKVNCYSYNSFDDITTRKIAGNVTNWLDLTDVDDKTAATIIYNDGVDVLIDLDTNLESSRPKLFAYDPAPVVLQYLAEDNHVTADIGYAGVLGGDCAYQINSNIDAIIKTGMAGLSHNLNTLALTISKMANAKTPHIGLAPSGSEVTPEFYESLKVILEAVPHAKIVLNTRHLGGGGTVERIEKNLILFEIRDRVEFTILDNDKHAAIWDFVAQCDLLVVLSNMKSADFTMEFVQSVKPVLAVKSTRPTNSETEEILKMLSLPNWCLSSLPDLCEELVSICKEDGTKYEELTTKLLSAIKENTDPEQLKLKGQDLYNTIGESRMRYLTSKAETETLGES